MAERAKLVVKTPNAKKGKSVPHARKTDFTQSLSSPIDYVLYLQRTIGNQAVQRLFKSGVIQAKLKIGQPLSPSLRAFFEPRFGRDFSSIRIHAGSEADHLNCALSARAFTYGQDIFFRQGEYNSGSSKGRALLAHELTHVLQQQGANQRALLYKKQDKQFNIGRAIKENQKKLRNKNSINLIQELLEVGTTGTFDGPTVESIYGFQLQSGAVLFENEEGVITPDTLSYLFYKITDKNKYQELISLIIDYYLRQSYEQLKSIITEIRYVESGEGVRKGADAQTIPSEEEGKSEIEVYPNAFQYAIYLAHAVAHEFEHVRQSVERFKQRKKGEPILPEIGVDEFRAEAFNILSENLPLKRFGDFMDDARRALQEWEKIPWQDVPREKEDSLLALLLKVRKKVLEQWETFKGTDIAGIEQVWQTKLRYEALNKDRLREFIKSVIKSQPSKSKEQRTKERVIEF